MCAVAAIHAADHCHAILTTTQQQSSQQQLSQAQGSLFPLPFMCHASGTMPAEEETTMITTSAADEATTTIDEATEATTMAVGGVKVDRLSIEHILQMSTATAAASTATGTSTSIATTATTADVDTTSTTTIATTTDDSTDLTPLTAYCSLVRHVIVKGQAPLPLHPLFTAPSSGNSATAGGAASGSVGSSSSSSSSSSSTTANAVATDRSSLLKQRTSARARYDTPSFVSPSAYTRLLTLMQSQLKELLTDPPLLTPAY